MTPYSSAVESKMFELYERLSEKDRRQYAGIEALKLGHGGVTYAAELFKCSRMTVIRGMDELNLAPSLPRKRDRKAGGGRKATIAKGQDGDIDGVFLSLLKEHTAGDPMDEKVKWTNLTRAAIADLLTCEGFAVSRNIVKKLLKRHGYVKRKALKKKAAGGHVNRNAQFENISRLRAEYAANGNPIMSVDSKKKEMIGNLFRNGKAYTTQTKEVFDHDFQSLAEGVAIPHTLYDVTENKAYMTLGTSRDTSEFACDSIRWWWFNYGKTLYPMATSILMLMDGGGSNSSRHYIFKEDLLRLVQEMGIEIRIAHYPPYTSKWNPIEHKVFPHVTRALSGAILTSHAFTKELVETTTTKKGLTVVAWILNKIYLTGRKVAAGFKENIKIHIAFDAALGLWNYVAKPMMPQVA